MKQEKPFESESALCTAFIESIDATKWTAYAETSGWDILLVRRADGFQIGIQAKMRLNVDVINQTIDEYGHWSVAAPGPDCRAVLVPSSSGFARICKYLALVIITPVQKMRSGGIERWRFDPHLPEAPPGPQYTEWPEWAPASRHALPDYVPDVQAGSKAPVRLTDWKIKAIKLSILLEKNGRVTRSDFKHLQLDHRRWIEGGWIAHAEGGFVAGPCSPNFRLQHPRVYEEIAADFDRWCSKDTPSLI